MVQLGSAEHTYEVSGKDWGDLPEGWTYKEATAVAVDSRDQVYVFNRGGHPIIIYDREGRFLRSWGEGVFGTIQQRSVESSNVEVVRELVNLIKAQRAFEMNSQTIQAADEALEVISENR